MKTIPLQPVSLSLFLWSLERIPFCTVIHQLLCKIWSLLLLNSPWDFSLGQRSSEFSRADIWICVLVACIFTFVECSAFLCLHSTEQWKGLLAFLFLQRGRGLAAPWHSLSCNRLMKCLFQNKHRPILKDWLAYHPYQGTSAKDKQSRKNKVCHGISEKRLFNVRNGPKLYELREKLLLWNKRILEVEIFFFSLMGFK